jgi:hypothetical protein
MKLLLNSCRTPSHTRGQSSCLVATGTRCLDSTRSIIYLLNILHPNVAQKRKLHWWIFEKMKSFYTYCHHYYSKLQVFSWFNNGFANLLSAFVDQCTTLKMNVICQSEDFLHPSFAINIINLCLDLFVD